MFTDTTVTQKSLDLDDLRVKLNEAMETHDSKDEYKHEENKRDEMLNKINIIPYVKPELFGDDQLERIKAK